MYGCLHRLLHWRAGSVAVGMKEAIAEPHHVLSGSATNRLESGVTALHHSCLHHMERCAKRLSMRPFAASQLATNAANNKAWGAARAQAA